jgi:tetratricopeptide (TPR) repeat protein
VYQDNLALRELEQAVSLDTSFALAYIQLSRIHGRLQDNEASMKCAESAWRMRDRLSAKDRMALEAYLAGKQGRPLDALAIHRKIYDRWPDDSEALRSLCGAYWGLSRYKEVLQHCEKFLSLYPDDIRSVAGLFWSGLWIHGNYERVYESINGFIERYPEELIGWEFLGFHYLQTACPDSAEMAFRRTLEIDPAFYYGFMGIASCSYHRGDLESSIREFKQMLDDDRFLDGQKYRALMDGGYGAALTMVYAENGQFQKAADSVKGSIKFLTGDDAETIYLRDASYILSRIGRSEELLRQALEMHGNDRGTVEWIRSLYPLARAFVAQDSLDSALEIARELYRLPETHGNMWSRFQSLCIEAEVELKRGDPGRAITLLKEAGEKFGLWRLGLIHIEWFENLARASMMKGNLEEAVRIHTDLLGIFGGHALSHYELGILYEELNRPVDAKREYEIFLEMWKNADEGLPQPEDARRRLASLTSS